LGNTVFAGYQRRLRIWETDYGRNAGWFIERRGEIIAVLTEPRWEDMFWDSYRIDITTEDSELRSLLQTEIFWTKPEGEQLVWRSREFGEVAEFAFPGGEPFPEPGRLIMRALYLRIGEPRPWDRLVLWFRKWRRQRTSRT
jgi:hypothetical protein